MCVGEWGRSTQEGHSEVSGSYRRKRHCQVGCLCSSWFDEDKQHKQCKVESLCCSLFFRLRFLLKNNKAQEEEHGGEATETPAIPTTPAAKETKPSQPSQPNPVPLHPETSTTEVPIKNSNQDRPMPTHPAPPSTSATSTLPVKQEEVPNSHDAVRPKVPPVEKGLSEEDGEKAGPSGLNSHPSASSYSAAPFIPFSGGGQRLGGPGGGAAGRSVSSSSSSSSLAAHTVAVESPKAKKAKSSHSSSTKVSCTTTRGANAPCISF